MKIHRRGLLARIRRRPPWRSDARVFRQHHQWGDACTWQSYEHGSVYGFGDFPRVGDVMTAQLKSGSEAAFIFTEVRIATNPSDMWTGTVEGLGYLPLEWPFPESKRPPSIMDDLV